MLYRSILLPIALLASACDAPRDSSTEFRTASGPSALAPNPDGDDNERGWGDLTCDYENGEVLVGIVSQDYGWDSLDGVSAICEAPDGSLRTLSFDGDMSNAQPEPNVVLCPPGERVEVLHYHDAEPWPGVPGDTTDAATVRCTNATERITFADLEGNPYPPHKIECPPGQIAVGVAYVDLDGPAYSDLTDAITLVCADEDPICEAPTDEAQPNPDTGNNNLTPLRLTCDEDETMVGVLHKDYGWDSMDGAGVLCEDDEGNVRELFHAGDLSNAAGAQSSVECGSGQVTGLAYKDAPAWPGVPGDTTDGITVICDGGSPETIADLEGNGNAWQLSECPAGSEAVGLEYVDLDAEAYNDLTDAISIVCRTC